MKDIGRVAVLDRGPTAMRVLQAVSDLARRDGPGAAPSTLVIHDDPVPDSEYTRRADNVLRLGPEAYRAVRDGRRHSHQLDYEHVISALRRAGVDLVWLGRGVVGDPAEFTRRCEAAGIPVVGPSGAVRTLLADRAAVLTSVQALDVPVPAWSGHPIPDGPAAVAVAERLGYPVCLVASGQTGRRGIHRVSDEAALLAAFGPARAAAARESGSHDLFVLADPDSSRTLEVDVLTDDAGTTWPLAVRDCSLMHAGQVILDECPPSSLPGALENRIRQAAARVASSLRLSGLASVRVRVGPDDADFAVLGVQVLPRLNHALTEEVTGLDVVAMTLRLARGQLLTGPPPPVLGHALQVRLLAQDPEHGHAATPGRIAALDLPAASGVRVDSGLRAGDLIPVGHTPLLANITVWGRTRGEALSRLRRALDDAVAVIEDGTANRTFLLSLLQEQPIQDATANPQWLEGYLARDGHRPPPDPLALVCAAIEAYEADRVETQVAFHAQASRGRPEQPELTGDRMLLGYRGVRYPLRVDHTAPGEYRVAGARLEAADAGVGVADASVERSGPFQRWVLCGGRRHRVIATQQGATLRLEIDGAAHLVTREDGIAISNATGTGTTTSTSATTSTTTSTSTSHPPGRVDFTSLGRPIDHLVDPCRRVYQPLSNYLLGYDLDPKELADLQTRQRRLAETAATDDASLLACEDALLDLFADLAGLFRPRTEDEEQTMAQELSDGGPQEHLLAYLQFLDADRACLPPAYRRRLERALARYGVIGLHRTPELEAAMLWMFQSFGRVPELAPMITAILERRLHNRDALVARTGPQFRARFDRLSAATQGRFPEVAELARDVRFHYLDEPILESEVAQVYAEMQGHLAALRADPHRADREHRIRRLVWCPQPLRGRLLRTWMDSPGRGSAAFRGTLIEVRLRRLYRIRPLHRVAVHEHAGCTMASADDDLHDLHDLHDHSLHVVMTYCALADLPEVSRAIAVHLEHLPATNQLVVDVHTWRPGERPEIDVLATQLTHLLSSCDFGRPLHRLDVTVTSATGAAQEHFRTQHLTYRHLREQGFVEDELYRNQHPMLSKRLELWRLRNFRLVAVFARGAKADEARRPVPTSSAPRIWSRSSRGHDRLRSLHRDAGHDAARRPSR